MNNKIEEVFVRFHDLSPGVKASVASGFAIVGFTIGALLQDRVQKLWGVQPGDRPLGQLWILILLIIAVAWGGVKLWYQRVLKSHFKNREANERTIADAREQIAKLSIQILARCDEMMEKETVSFDEFRSVLICEIDRINGLITTAWQVVNSHHNVSVAATERINFEMTLITPSLRDSELTIAAWCNRDNLRPKSLLIRDQGNIIIYRRTEAAKMITKRATDTIIIEDTSAPKENYEHLYEGQKERIRSCVLHPILSSKNEHLGVLVLHCERAGFFHDGDRRYWHELFSVFAPLIAVELERIRAFNKMASTWPSLPTGTYLPF